jgi:hypothetical protein
MSRLPIFRRRRSLLMLHSHYPPQADTAGLTISTWVSSSQEMAGSGYSRLVLLAQMAKSCASFVISRV